MDNEILIINTGGTFNKKYNKIKGDYDLNPLTINEIFKRWSSPYYRIFHIIQKDSLDFTNEDRELLLKTIKKSEYKKIIVIHGTDTMDISADYINKENLDKTIIFTGAMTPYDIEQTEATANLVYSIATIKLLSEVGVFISMNGVFGNYREIVKNRKLGFFEKKNSKSKL